MHNDKSTYDIKKATCKHNITNITWIVYTRIRYGQTIHTEQDCIELQATSTLEGSHFGGGRVGVRGVEEMGGSFR